MKILLKTKGLLFLAVVMGGLVIWDTTPKIAAETSLPTIEAITRTDISKVALTSMGNTITLENQAGEWVEIAPLSGLADIARINAMILNFRNPISMDVLIEANPEQAGKEYGLDASNAITVEMWRSDADEPSISFLIGKDAGQGSSFVRLSGGKAVYRANVGSRRRFAYPASDWLNQRVFRTRMSDLSSIEVQSLEHDAYTLQNGEQWTLENSDYPVDLSRLVNALQDLLLVRIGNVVEKGVESQIENPWLQLSLNEKDGSTKTVLVDVPVDRQTRVQIDGMTYEVPVLPFEHFVGGAGYFADRRVFSIRSRDELDLIRFTTDITDIIIQQDLSNGFWKVLQPSNVDLEMRDAFFMVNTLATLSSLAEVSSSLVDEETPKLTVEIRRLQGDVMRLKVFKEYDQNGVQGYLCSIDGMESAFVAVKDDIERIINGFGQANVF